LERGKHPRVVIGESSTPLANLLLEELCRRYDLPAVAPLAKWGSWQRSYPQIGCGLKRGFTFYHHHLDEPDDRNALIRKSASRRRKPARRDRRHALVSEQTSTPFWSNRSRN
jgi:hypothetical protein